MGSYCNNLTLETMAFENYFTVRLANLCDKWKRNKKILLGIFTNFFSWSNLFSSIIILHLLSQGPILSLPHALAPAILSLEYACFAWGDFWVIRKCMHTVSEKPICNKSASRDHCRLSWKWLPEMSRLAHLELGIRCHLCGLQIVDSCENGGWWSHWIQRVVRSAHRGSLVVNACADHHQFWTTLQGTRDEHQINFPDSKQSDLEFLSTWFFLIGGLLYLPLPQKKPSSRVWAGAVHSQINE